MEFGLVPVPVPVDFTGTRPVPRFFMLDYRFSLFLLISYLHHVLPTSSLAESSAPLQFRTVSHATLQFPDCITTSRAPLQFLDCITCSPPVPRLYHVFPSSSQTASRHHVLPSSSQTVSRAPETKPVSGVYKGNAYIILPFCLLFSN